MPSLSPRSRIKTLENQAARLRNQYKAANANYIRTREAALLRRKAELLKNLKNANNRVRRARSAAAKKRAATATAAAVTRKLNTAINQHLKNFAKQGIVVDKVTVRSPLRGPPMRPRRV
jgi:hypothetical protein